MAAWGWKWAGTGHMGWRMVSVQALLLAQRRALRGGPPQKSENWGLGELASITFSSHVASFPLTIQISSPELVSGPEPAAGPEFSEWTPTLFRPNKTAFGIRRSLSGRGLYREGPI